MHLVENNGFSTGLPGKEIAAMEEMGLEKEPWKVLNPEEFLYLDQRTRVWASQKIPNSTDSELAADKAITYFLDRVLARNPPQNPYSWLWRAIDRLAMKWRKGKKGMISLDEDYLRKGFSAVDSLPNQLIPQEERDWKERARRYLKVIRPELEKLLTKRQRLAFEAILEKPSLKKAAEKLGITLWEVGNLIFEIAKKAKKSGKIANPPP